jgi:hypothetical protein
MGTFKYPLQLIVLVRTDLLVDAAGGADSFARED